MRGTLTAEPEWLRAESEISSVRGRVDRENGMLRGYTVAEMGPFKDGRGEFNGSSLDAIVRLGNETASPGLRSRFGHPNLSSDGLASFLGRSNNFQRRGQRVIADLKFSSASFKEPPDGGRPRADYIMEVLEEDPSAMSSSLVLMADRIPQLDANGDPVLGDDGNPVPDIWIPTALRASDIVEIGAAVGSLLSDQDHPDSLVKQATDLLNEAFPDVPVDVLGPRLRSFLDRYLSNRYGVKPAMTQPTNQNQPPTQPPAQPPVSNDVLAQILQLTAEQKKSTDAVLEHLAAERAEREKAAQKESDAKAIVALCTAVKHPGLAEAFLQQERSLSEVKDELLVVLAKDNPPAAGGDDVKLVAGSDSAKLASLRAEYDANKDIHAKLGVSFEQYASLTATGVTNDGITVTETADGHLLQIEPVPEMTTAQFVKRKQELQGA